MTDDDDMPGVYYVAAVVIAVMAIAMLAGALHFAGQLIERLM